MGSSGTWSGNSGQTSIHVHSIEVRYLSLMPIVKPFARESYVFGVLNQANMLEIKEDKIFIYMS